MSEAIVGEVDGLKGLELREGVSWQGGKGVLLEVEGFEFPQLSQVW